MTNNEDFEPLDIGMDADITDSSVSALLLETQWDNKMQPVGSIVHHMPINVMPFVDYANEQNCNSQPQQQRNLSNESAASFEPIPFMGHGHERATESDRLPSSLNFSMPMLDNLRQAIGLVGEKLSSTDDGTLEPLPTDQESVKSQSSGSSEWESRLVLNNTKPEVALSGSQKQKPLHKGASVDKESPASSGGAGSAKSRRSIKASCKLFPNRLYEMLENAEAYKFDHIISFIPSGKSFQIHDRKLFEREVMPQWFHKMKSFNSFHRQLNFYSFRRKNCSIDCCIFSHEKFRRGGKQQLRHMKRK